MSDRIFINVMELIILVFCLYIFYDLNKQNTDKYSKMLITLGISAFFTIFISVHLYLHQFYKFPLSLNTSDWANFGSYFGGVISPILTFITLIYLIYSNKKDREKYDKKEEQYSIEVKKNNFDKMFTLMLEQHNNYLEKPEFIKDVNVLYEKLLKSQESYYNYSRADLNPIFNEYSVINTYLRLLYRILKYLVEENQAIGNYSRLLRAFFSEQLLFIVASNSLRMEHHNKDYGDYKDLLVESEFLEHMNLPKLYDKWANNLISKIEFLQRLEIKKQDDSTFIYIHYSSYDKRAISRPLTKIELAKYIKEKTEVETNSLFQDIISIEPSAFCDSEDYKNCKKNKMKLEKALEKAIEDKIEELNNC